MPISQTIGLVVGASVLLGLIFAFFSVYDTNSVPFWKRVIFWTATMITGLGASVLVLPLFPRDSLGQYGLWLRIIPIAIIVSLPVTVVLAAFQGNTGIDAPFARWIYMYGRVLPISLLVIALQHIFFAIRDRDLLWAADLDSGEHSSPAFPSRGEHPFFEKLPHALRSADLYAVSAEDHYLRVHTSGGEDLILMRLGDAITALRDVRGVQVHRSWWVASDGISSTRSDAGKRKLVLKSGTEVPVSRTYSKAAKDAGLF